MSPDDAVFDRIDVFMLLRKSLNEYGNLIQDPFRYQIFLYAFDMEIVRENPISADPGTFDTFEQICPKAVSLREAYAVSATFVEMELVESLRVDAAKLIVSDLWAAAADPASAVPILRRWYTLS